MSQLRHGEHVYETVICWLEDTQIEYEQPNPKRPDSKYFKRYEEYSTAKTVGEAVAKGTKGWELLNDFDFGHLKVVGGPVRVQPLDLRDWGESWTPTDLLMAGLNKGFKRAQMTNNLAERIGIDRRCIIIDKVSRDTAQICARRNEAQAVAKLILQEAAGSGQKLTDVDVLTVLRLWEFKQNTRRQNVMKEGWKWVNSDTLGLLSSYDGSVSVTDSCRNYPAVSQLLCRWLRDHLPTEMEHGFAFTSININRGYAAKLHRDGNNEGPSVLCAFGGFTGGHLNYWPDDDKQLPLEKFRVEDSVSVDVNENLLLFDGNRGHSVDDFQGERYSLVFFSIARHSKASEDQRQTLRECGICFPKEGDISRIMSLMDPPRGFTDTLLKDMLSSKPIERRQKPRVLYWSCKQSRQGSPVCERLEAEQVKRTKEVAREGVAHYGTLTAAMPYRYSEKTYETVLRWRADTEIAYLPKAEKVDPDDHVRYEEYCVAKTVQEALARGTTGIGLLHDFEVGNVRAVGGPIREEPLDSKDWDESWTDTDLMLAVMHRGWTSWVAEHSVHREVTADPAHVAINGEFVDYTVERFLRPDGLRSVRVLLADTSGRLVPAVEGIEVRKGTQHYRYSKVKEFEYGAPFVPTDKMWLVMDWVSEIVVERASSTSASSVERQRADDSVKTPRRKTKTFDAAKASTKKTGRKMRNAIGVRRFAQKPAPTKSKDTNAETGEAQGSKVSLQLKMFGKATFQKLLRCTSTTKVEFASGAKQDPSKASHKRYIQYSKAKTLLNAMRLGALAGDLLHDCKAGYLRIVGGRMRVRAPEPNKCRDRFDRLMVKWQQTLDAQEHALASLKHRAKPAPFLLKTYSRDTLETLACCTGDTPIEYVPEGKTATSHKGSYERYAEYSQARTLQEALDLGSSGPDLMYDFEHGLIKLRCAPMARKFKQVGATLTRFDRLVITWKATLEAADRAACDATEGAEGFAPAGAEGKASPATEGKTPTPARDRAIKRAMKCQGSMPVSKVACKADTKTQPLVLQGCPREIVELLLACTANTPVEYMPDAVTVTSHPGTYERYAKYSKARTIQEALELGANGKDLLHDCVHRFLKIVGDPKREGPLTTPEVAMTRFERMQMYWQAALNHAPSGDALCNASKGAVEAAGDTCQHMGSNSRCAMVESSRSLQNHSGSDFAAHDEREGRPLGTSAGPWTPSAKDDDTIKKVASSRKVVPATGRPAPFLLRAYPRTSLEQLALCTAGTRIEYVQNAKTATSHKGSYERYAVYSKALTFEQALSLGSSGQDFLYDYTNKFLKVNHTAPVVAVKNDGATARFQRLVMVWRATLELHSCAVGSEQVNSCTAEQATSGGVAAEEPALEDGVAQSSSPRSRVAEVKLACAGQNEGPAPMENCAREYRTDNAMAEAPVTDEKCNAGTEAAEFVSNEGHTKPKANRNRAGATFAESRSVKRARADLGCQKAAMEKLAFCAAATLIEYVPGAKTAVTHKGSYERYERYAKAQTLQEAMDLGAMAGDLLFDYTHGFLKVVDARRPEEPYSREEASKTRFGKLATRWQLRLREIEATTRSGISNAVA